MRWDVSSPLAGCGWCSSSLRSSVWVGRSILALGTLAGFAPGQFTSAWIRLPDGWGYGLPVVYMVWPGVVLALYPACRWFATVKARRRDPWLSYL